MPIEIKELHIKINVDEGSKNLSGEKARQAERNKIIEACVEQVMDIMAKKQER